MPSLLLNPVAALLFTLAFNYFISTYFTPPPYLAHTQHPSPLPPFSSALYIDKLFSLLEACNKTCNSLKKEWKWQRQNVFLIHQM